jgi:HEAT repeat protein
MADPSNNGPSFERSSLPKLAVFALVLVGMFAIATKSGAVERAWQVLTGNKVAIDTPGPVQVSKPVVSEHEREWINGQNPQAQMEELMRAAINHEEGSTAMIAQKLPSWRGHLKDTKTWSDLMMTALYSNDLRVRAAAIEINLEVQQLPKTAMTVDGIIYNAEDNPSQRPWAAWMLGMLANRGVETDKVVARLEQWMHDPDEQTRLWAVEGLANVGTDSTINDFVSVLKNDDSMKVRERAGCSLAKSGMLTRVQRMHAVPGLIDLADDSSLNDQTRNWVYQALREITEQNLPNNSGAWRDWYLSHGQDLIQKFAAADSNRVLGNS